MRCLVMRFRWVFLQGCTRGTHTAETLKEESSRPLPSASESIKMTSSQDGKEVYGVPSIASTKKSSQTASAIPSDITPSQPVEEEDNLDAPVAPGTTCRHNGCRVVFVSDEQNRKGEGPGTSCTYHPANVSVPIREYPHILIIDYEANLP